MGAGFWLAARLLCTVPAVSHTVVKICCFSCLPQNVNVGALLFQLSHLGHGAGSLRSGVYTLYIIAWFSSWLADRSAVVSLSSEPATPWFSPAPPAGCHNYSVSVGVTARPHGQFRIFFTH